MKRYLLFLKIGLLVGLSLLIAFLLLKELYFTAVMCFIILLGTAFSLYQDQRKMLQKMEHLIANIHYGDMNLSFPIPSTDGPEANLTRAMNEALSAFRTRLYNVVVAEAETEAWQKLIRVLTHEIMNSIAPIISLSETVTERASSNGLNEPGLQHYVASHANDTPSEQRVIGFCRKLSETDSYSDSDAAVVSGFLSF